MNIIDTPLKDVKILEPKVFGDDRGFFLESYHEDWFKTNVADVNFVQDNHSKSKQGILRGLHYQTKKTQGKLVRAVQGEVFDVVVDMRKNSISFGQSFGLLLSAENKRQLWVPAGFAHGFYVTSESAEFVYKCTDYYAPEHEFSLLWNDAQLSIDWPLQDGFQPQLSEKDKQGVPFSHSFYFE